MTPIISPIDLLVNYRDASIDLYKKLVNNLDNTSAEIVASGERIKSEIVASGERAKAEILAFGERSQAKFQALLDRKGKRSNNTELTTTTHKLEEPKNSIIPSTQKVLDTSTSGKPHSISNEINDRLAAIRAKRLNKPDTLNTVVSTNNTSSVGETKNTIKVVDSTTSNEINDRLAAIRAKRLNKIVEPNTTISVNNRNNTKEVSVVLPKNKASVSVGTQTDNTVAVVTPKKTVTTIDQGTQTENKLPKQDVAKLTLQADGFLLGGKYKEAQEKYDIVLNQYESSKKRNY
jgi:hypothetical protein